MEEEYKQLNEALDLIIKELNEKISCANSK